MIGTSSALDEGFERLAASGFELPNGFVNHGPMACEALAALGREDYIDGWARRFARAGGIEVVPVREADFEWRGGLGEYRLLPEWIGYFERAFDDDGWPAVVEVWVPRLMPALAVALFHAALRTGHAVRAIGTVDTAPRRAELARALGYWAARFRDGQPAAAVEEPVDDVRSAIIEAAAQGARWFVAQPDILRLHGVTGAMAVELLVDHIPPAAGVAGLAQVRAEHVDLYGGTEAPVEDGAIGGDDDELARVAAESGDPHQVKLVEACRRGFEASGDQAFVAAAITVTGLG